ncbi:VOC family protein [Sphingobium indicum]|uniref:VOC family protein n=1 Tax=Sphingobium indicum TaxID=332055 RepID=UPI0009DB103A|nr:VOC family protein [Sphingobium indicum]
MKLANLSSRSGLLAAAGCCFLLWGGEALASDRGLMAAPVVSNAGGEQCRATARVKVPTPKTLSAGMFQSKLIVENLERMSSFYSEVLQTYQTKHFTSTMNMRPMEEKMFESPNGVGHPLVLIRFLDSKHISHGQVVLVFFTDDMDAFISRVQQCGGRVTERRDDTEHKVRIAFWYDPEGNLVETVQLGYEPQAK